MAASLAASGGIANAALLFAGLSGAVGVIATGGLIALGVLALRLIVKTVKEITIHSQDFKNIWSEDNSRWGITKIGLTLGLGFKCLAIGIAKTLLTDELFSKVTDYFAMKSFAKIRNWFRVYPEKETVQREKTLLRLVKYAITDVENKLKTSDVMAIEKAFEKLTEAMTEAKRGLDNRAINQQRADGYDDLLAGYNRQYQSLKALMANMKTIYIAEHSAQPVAEPMVEVAERPVSPASPRAQQLLQVDISGFLQGKQVELAKEKVLELQTKTVAMESLVAAFKHAPQPDHEFQAKDLIAQAERLLRDVEIAVNKSGEPAPVQGMLFAGVNGPARTALYQAVRFKDAIKANADIIFASLSAQKIKQGVADIQIIQISQSLEEEVQILRTPRDMAENLPADEDDPYRTLREKSFSYQTKAALSLAKAKEIFDLVSLEHKGIQQMISIAPEVIKLKTDTNLLFRQAEIKVRELEIKCSKAENLYKVALMKIDYLTMQATLATYPALKSANLWTYEQKEGLKKIITPVHNALLADKSIQKPHEVKEAFVALLKPYVQALKTIKLPDPKHQGARALLN